MTKFTTPHVTPQEVAFQLARRWEALTGYQVSFSVLELETAKTTLRLIPVFICSCWAGQDILLASIFHSGYFRPLMLDCVSDKNHHDIDDKDDDDNSEDEDNENEEENSDDGEVLFRAKTHRPMSERFPTTQAASCF